MSEMKPIRISGLQAAEWGAATLETARDILCKVTEEQTGRPHEWIQLINMDAIELVPVRDPPKVEPKPYARIDLYPGHVIAQYLPGDRDRMLRELLVLVNNLTLGAPVPFVQIAEVEAVKE